MNLKNKLLIIFVSLLLITQFIFQLSLAKTDSQTTDEAVHLSAGYTYLTKHDFRFNPEHPPLVKLLAGAPLLALKLNVPADKDYFDKAENYFYDSWKENRLYAEYFLYGLGNNADLILFASRVPMALLTLLLALTIFIISSKLWGTNGGVLSLGLYILEPIVLAHGHLVTTDIGVTLGYLLATSLLWRLLRSPNWINVVWFGLALGIAEEMKFTAIILVPAIFILLIYYAFAFKIRFKSLLALVGKIIVSGAIAFVIIWAGYFFKIDRAPQAQTTQVEVLNQFTSSKTFDILKPILIPRDYFKGLALVLGHTQNGHDAYLLGKTSKTGWWYYFPVLFSAKTTIPFILIVVLSLFVIFKEEKNRRRSIFFLLCAAIFLAFAMSSKADLGVRHILPVYGILFVICGASAKTLLAKKAGRIILSLLILLILIEDIKTYPNYLSYYNELYGGTSNGYKIATDSNYDWGQDLKKIKAYLDNHPDISNPLIEYGWDGTQSISYYKIPAIPVGIFSPEYKGFLIIGATGLSTPTYASLKNVPIYARISPSVFVYKL